MTNIIEGDRQEGDMFEGHFSLGSMVESYSTRILPESQFLSMADQLLSGELVPFAPDVPNDKLVRRYLATHSRRNQFSSTLVAVGVSTDGVISALAGRADELTDDPSQTLRDGRFRELIILREEVNLASRIFEIKEMKDLPRPENGTRIGELREQLAAGMESLGALTKSDLPQLLIVEDFLTLFMEAMVTRAQRNVEKVRQVPIITSSELYTFEYSALHINDHLFPLADVLSLRREELFRGWSDQEVMAVVQTVPELFSDNTIQTVSDQLNDFFNKKSDTHPASDDFLRSIPGEALHRLFNFRAERPTEATRKQAENVVEKVRRIFGRGTDVHLVFPDLGSQAEDTYDTTDTTAKRIVEYGMKGLDVEGIAQSIDHLGEGLTKIDGDNWCFTLLEVGKGLGPERAAVIKEKLTRSAIVSRGIRDVLLDKAPGVLYWDGTNLQVAKADRVPSDAPILHTSTHAPTVQTQKEFTAALMKRAAESRAASTSDVSPEKAVPLVLTADEDQIAPNGEYAVASDQTENVLSHLFSGVDLEGVGTALQKEKDDGAPVSTERRLVFDKEYFPAGILADERSHAIDVVSFDKHLVTFCLNPDVISATLGEEVLPVELNALLDTSGKLKFLSDTDVSSLPEAEYLNLLALSLAKMKVRDMKIKVKELSEDGKDETESLKDQNMRAEANRSIRHYNYEANGGPHFTLEATDHPPRVLWLPEFQTSVLMYPQDQK